MLFENLDVDRLIIHEVHRRLDDRQAIPPTYGQQILDLDADALAVFRDRVVSAMGSRSQSMEMAISIIDAESAIQIAKELVSATDDDFVVKSRRYADKLTKVQISRSLPGGILILFTGTAGTPAHSIAGVIKAETHSGFRLTPGMQVQYLRDLFMTPQTKLYKIGVFAYNGPVDAPDLPHGWTAMIYDSQMSGTKRDGAAQYFYELFLGCSIPLNNAQLTKQFFEGTKDFIKHLGVSEEEKSDLLTGLYTYLKVDKSTTVELNAFSNQYIDPNLKDDYENFMAQRSFPQVAVAKDIAEIQSYLRKRKISFSRNIQLTAPPDAFQDMVDVRTIQGDVDAGGVTSVWTQITIRDRIRDQE